MKVLLDLKEEARGSKKIAQGTTGSHLNWTW